VKIQSLLIKIKLLSVSVFDFVNPPKNHERPRLSSAVSDDAGRLHIVQGVRSEQFPNQPRRSGVHLQGGQQLSGATVRETQHLSGK
jgi:hypothetical protein